MNKDKAIALAAYFFGVLVSSVFTLALAGVAIGIVWGVASATRNFIGG